MVNTCSFTRSSHPQQPQLMQPPPSAPGASNDPDLRDFLKSMAESMEVLRKQNEELNARITAAEARSSERRENAPSAAKKISETGSIAGNAPSTPKGTTKVLFKEKMRKIEASPAERMGGLEGIEHTERSPHEGNLGVKEGRVKSLTEKGVKKKSLTDLSGTEKNSITRSPGGATRKQK
jgi:hypothetical protein